MYYKGIKRLLKVGIDHWIPVGNVLFQAPSMYKAVVA